MRVRADPHLGGAHHAAQVDVEAAEHVGGVGHAGHQIAQVHRLVVEAARALLPVDELLRGLVSEVVERRELRVEARVAQLVDRMVELPDARVRVDDRLG